MTARAASNYPRPHHPLFFSGRGQPAQQLHECSRTQPAVCPAVLATGAHTDGTRSRDLGGDGYQWPDPSGGQSPENPPCTLQVSRVKAKGRKSRACLSRALGGEGPGCGFRQAQVLTPVPAPRGAT